MTDRTRERLAMLLKHATGYANERKTTGTSAAVLSVRIIQALLDDAPPEPQPLHRCEWKAGDKHATCAEYAAGDLIIDPDVDSDTCVKLWVNYCPMCGYKAKKEIAP